MKRELIALSGLAVGIGLVSCGGDSSRGLSSDIPVFNTVMVTAKAVDKNPLESDVIIRTQRTAPVIAPDSTGTCNAITTATDVCIGTTFKSDSITITFNSQTIKNAQGQPATPNPSPVLVEKYRVSFTGCIPGVYEFPVGAVLTPDADTQVAIQPITLDMKEAIAVQGTYFYSKDGCLTGPFPVTTYPSLCNATANMEFYLVELNSGLRRTLKYSIAVRFADFNTSDDQCLR